MEPQNAHLEFMGIYEVDTLIEQTRKLAVEYRRTTGQPLPVTTEIANHDAVRLLHLQLIQPPPGGYDAIGTEGPRKGVRYQIKGRAIYDGKQGGQRIGQIKINQEWDAIILVLLDDELQPFEIYEASRAEVEDAISATSSSSRNNRGAMSVARFKMIARLIWDSSQEDSASELWENHPD